MHWQQPHNLELQQHVHNLEHSRQGLLVGSSVEQQLAAASQTLAAAQKVAEQTSQAIAALHGGARGMQCLWHPAREAALANPQGLCCPGLLPAGTEALQTDQPPKTFDKQPDQSDSDDGFGSFLSSLLSPDGDNSHSSDIMPSAGMSLHTSGESAAWNIAPPANPQLLQVPVLPPSTCNSSPAVTSRTQLPEMATSTVGTIVTGQTSTGPVLGTQLHQNGNLLRSSQVLGPSIGLGLHVDTAIACAHVQPAQQQGGNIWPLVSHDSTVPTSGISSSGMYGACALDLRVPLPGAEEQLRALGATLQQLSHVVNSLVERTRVR